MRQTYQINETSTLKHSSSVSSMNVQANSSTISTIHHNNHNSNMSNNNNNNHHHILSNYNNNNNSKYITSHPLSTTTFPK
jgi:hypothetical protein